MEIMLYVVGPLCLRHAAPVRHKQCSPKGATLLMSSPYIEHRQYVPYAGNAHKHMEQDMDWPTDDCNKSICDEGGARDHSATVKSPYVDSQKSPLRYGSTAYKPTQLGCMMNRGDHSANVMFLKRGLQTLLYCQDSQVSLCCPVASAKYKQPAHSGHSDITTTLKFACHKATEMRAHFTTSLKGADIFLHMDASSCRDGFYMRYEEAICKQPSNSGRSCISECGPFPCHKANDTRAHPMPSHNGADICVHICSGTRGEGSHMVDAHAIYVLYGAALYVAAYEIWKGLCMNRVCTGHALITAC